MTSIQGHCINSMTHSSSVQQTDAGQYGRNKETKHIEALILEQGYLFIYSCYANIG